MAKTLARRPAVPMRKQPLRQQVAKYWMDYLFISPFFISFAIFGLYPLLWALQLSVSSWRGFGPMRWVGLDNYRAMLVDPYIRQALVNTLQFTAILLPTGILISLVLAVVLNNKNLKGRGLFRTIYFLPFITSDVIIALVFLQLFDDSLGWINTGLQAAGLSPVGWLRGDAWAAKIAIVLLTHWGGIGYNVLFFLGGLQGIEPELFEAAQIDGANEWQIFWRVTIPLLRQTILFLVIIATIGLMSLFNPVFVLTSGGPQGETRTLMFRLYEIAFQGGGRYGDSAAFGFLIGFLVIILALVQLRVARTD